MKKQRKTKIDSLVKEYALRFKGEMIGFTEYNYERDGEGARENVALSMQYLLADLNEEELNYFWDNARAEE